MKPTQRRNFVILGNSYLYDFKSCSLFLLQQSLMYSNEYTSSSPMTSTSGGINVIPWSPGVETTSPPPY